MVILKKIKSATLIEALTASVIIIIVFMIASLSFNNIFSSGVKMGFKSKVDNKIKELRYQQIHEMIELPYSLEIGKGEYNVFKDKEVIVIRYADPNFEREVQYK